MTAHDPLCPWPPHQCQCDRGTGLIAKVRNDERIKVWDETGPIITKYERRLREQVQARRANALRYEGHDWLTVDDVLALLEDGGEEPEVWVDVPDDAPPYGGEAQ